MTAKTAAQRQAERKARELAASPHDNRSPKMTTYRAAYIPPEFGSNGVGLRLTTEDEAGLPDDQLMAAAQRVAEDIGAQGDIVIGEWTE